MAYTINVQPTSLAYSRSPVLYQVYDPLAASLSKFRYIAEVYVWEGAITPLPGTESYILKRYPNADNSAHFNLSQLLREYFDSIDPTIATGYGSTMVYNLAVVFKYEYDLAGTITEVAGATSNTIQVVNGYTRFPNGVNYTHPDNTGQSFVSEYTERVVGDGGIVEAVGCIPQINAIENGGRFMTDQPTQICIPDNQKWTFSLYYDRATSVTQFIRVTDDAGIYYDIDLRDYVISGANSDSKEYVLTIQVGSDQLSKNGLSPARYYYVRGLDINKSPITEIYRFEVCCTTKWGYTQMQFINKYGAWDYIPFWGREDEDFSSTRSTFENDVLDISQADVTYNTYDGQYEDFNINGRTDIKINTGWLHEDYSKVIKQLYLSTYIIDADTQLPYILNGNNVAIRNWTNENLLNWVIPFKAAYDEINSVG